MVNVSGMKFMAITLWIFVIAALIGCLVANTSCSQVKAAESDQIVIYQLAGPHAMSYRYVADKPEPQNLFDGIIDLVNPRIAGERVYIPEHLNLGRGADDFFFVDQLEVYKGAIYRPAGIIRIMVDNGTGKEPTPMSYNPTLPKGMPYVLGTLWSGHLDRVYVDDPTSGTADKRFIPREDLSLVRPAL